MTCKKYIRVSDIYMFLTMIFTILLVNNHVIKENMCVKQYNCKHFDEKTKICKIYMRLFDIHIYVSITLILAIFMRHPVLELKLTPGECMSSTEPSHRKQVTFYVRGLRKFGKFQALLTALDRNVNVYKSQVICPTIDIQESIERDWGELSARRTNCYITKTAGTIKAMGKHMEGDTVTPKINSQAIWRKA